MFQFSSFKESGFTIAQVWGSLQPGLQASFAGIATLGKHSPTKTDEFLEKSQGREGGRQGIDAI